MPTSLDELIDHIKQRLAGPELNDDDEVWPPKLTSPVSPERIEAVEAELGFALPPLLKRIYSEISDGNFGPAYGLVPFEQAEKGADRESLVSLYRKQHTDTWRQEYPEWPMEMLRIVSLGCGMYTTVDCSTSDHQLYLYEPNNGPNPEADDVMLANCLFSYNTTLNEWWEEWTQGTDVQLPEDMREPEFSDEDEDRDEPEDD